jgi:hypothetical protein
MSCKIKTFDIYREDRLDGYGGVLLGVQKSLESIPIKLNMRNKKIEVIARKIVINKNYEFDVASVYIPPNIKITKNDLRELTNSLKEPFYIVGDLNGHGIEWGCFTENEKGKIIQEMLDECSCTTINNGDFTRLQPFPKISSALDIAITNNTNALNCSWEVINNSCGSDHLPAMIYVKLQDCKMKSKGDKVKVKKILMKKYYNNLRNLNMVEQYDMNNCEDYIQFKSYLNKIEEKSEVIIKINDQPLIKPWWNSECSLAFAKIITATKKFKKTGNVSDFLEKKKAEANSRKVNKQIREIYWRNRCSSISHQTSVGEVWKIVRYMKVALKLWQGKMHTVQQPKTSIGLTMWVW